MRVFVFTTALLAACSGDTTATTEEPAEPAAEEPAKEEPKEEPAADAGTPEERGKKTYEEICIACHQADGTGLNQTLAADFNDPKRLEKSDDDLVKSILEGVSGDVGVMPPWGSQIDEAQARDALAYIRATYGKKE